MARPSFMVSAVNRPDYFVTGDAHGGKPRRGPMAVATMGAPLRYSEHHRQDRLRAIKRLNLALLVDTQHPCPIRRARIQTRRIAHFLDKQRASAHRFSFGSPVHALDRKENKLMT